MFVLIGFSYCDYFAGFARVSVLAKVAWVKECGLVLWVVVIALFLIVLLCVFTRSTCAYCELRCCAYLFRASFVFCLDLFMVFYLVFADSCGWLLVLICRL